MLLTIHRQRAAGGDSEDGPLGPSLVWPRQEAPSGGSGITGRVDSESPAAECVAIADFKAWPLRLSESDHPSPVQAGPADSLRRRTQACPSRGDEGPAARAGARRGALSDRDSDKSR